MIRYLKHNEIDYDLWDSCIKNADNKVPYAVSWLLDEVCEDWCALVLNDYTAVMPIVSKSKLGIKYIYPGFPLQQLGVIGKNVDGSTVRDFISAIPSKYKYVEMNLNESNSEVNFVQSTEMYNNTLELNRNYTELYSHYSQNLKRNIKKAVKAQFTIQNNINPQLIVQLFKNTKGKIISDISEQDYSVLYKIMQKAISNNKGISVGAYKNDKLHSACFFLKSLNHLIYLKGASDETGKKYGAMHFIMDEIIKENASTDQVLNFAGSNISSLARFYSSFGTAESIYLQIKINNLPKAIRRLKK